MQLISKFNKGIRLLICVVDIHSKCTWIVLLKEKKGIRISYAFQKMLDESGRKPSKILVDKDSILQ